MGSFRHRDRDRDRDRDRSGSGHHQSSSSSHHPRGDRERDRDHHRESSKNRDRDRNRDKDRDREKDRDKDRDRGDREHTNETYRHSNDAVTGKHSRDRDPYSGSASGSSGTSNKKKKMFQKRYADDPTVYLARGLSSRFIGWNVLPQIAPLAKEEIEKDLRHMNAFYNANIAYAQQHYLYMNRDTLANNKNEDSTNEAGQDNGQQQDSTTVPTTATSSSYHHHHHSSTNSNAYPPHHHIMPVRIDPEEEKRLQNLRKKIALCETQREFLEGQYVSLRAHYVAISKQLQSTIDTTQTQQFFLQNLTKCRSKVLSYQRVRLQILRDVQDALISRQKQLLRLDEVEEEQGDDQEDAEKQKQKEANLQQEKGEQHGKKDAGERSNQEVGNQQTAQASVSDMMDVDDLEDVDILSIWNQIEEMLQQEERACRSIPPPTASEAAKLRISSPGTSSTNNNISTQTTFKSGPEKTKSNSKKVSSTGTKIHDDMDVDEPEEEDEREDEEDEEKEIVKKRNLDKDNEDHNSDENEQSDHDDSDNNMQTKEDSDSNQKHNNSKDKSSKKDNARNHRHPQGFPWAAPKMPQTPPGIPLLLSQLSNAPDRFAAFATNGMFGGNRGSLCWSEPDLPKTAESVTATVNEIIKNNMTTSSNGDHVAANDGKSYMEKLHDEVNLLENELVKERNQNQDIQNDIIARRRRSDELVAMMTLLRIETEAVLQRHNILLDSSQAKQAAKKLHEKAIIERRAAKEAAQIAAIAAEKAASEHGVEKHKQHKSSAIPRKDRSAAIKTKDKQRSDHEQHHEDDGDDEVEEGEEIEEGEEVEVEDGEVEEGEVEEGEVEEGEVEEGEVDDDHDDEETEDEEDGMLSPASKTKRTGASTSADTSKTSPTSGKRKREDEEENDGDDEGEIEENEEDDATMETNEETADGPGGGGTSAVVEDDDEGVIAEDEEDGEVVEAKVEEVEEADAEVEAEAIEVEAEVDVGNEATPKAKAKAEGDIAESKVDENAAGKKLVKEDKKEETAKGIKKEGKGVSKEDAESKKDEKAGAKATKPDANEEPKVHPKSKNADLNDVKDGAKVQDLVRSDSVVEALEEKGEAIFEGFKNEMNKEIGEDKNSDKASTAPTPAVGDNKSKGTGSTTENAANAIATTEASGHDSSKRTLEEIQEPSTSDKKDEEIDDDATATADEDSNEESKSKRQKVE